MKSLSSFLQLLDFDYGTKTRIKVLESPEINIVKSTGVLKWSLDIREPLVLIPFLIDATVSAALPHGQYL